jgi:hypothetical protein
VPWSTTLNVSIAATATGAPATGCVYQLPMEPLRVTCVGPYEVGALRLEEAIMLKLIALLGAMAALTSCSDERRFFPRRDFAERRDFCCEESRFFPRREFEESRDFCCEERRFFPRREFEESWF